MYKIMYICTCTCTKAETEMHENETTLIFREM